MRLIATMNLCSWREAIFRFRGSLLSVIEFEDGSIYREESRDMAATIRAGKLDERRGATA